MKDVWSGPCPYCGENGANVFASLHYQGWFHSHCTLHALRFGKTILGEALIPHEYPGLSYLYQEGYPNEFFDSFEDEAASWGEVYWPRVYWRRFKKWISSRIS